MRIKIAGFFVFLLILAVGALAARLMYSTGVFVSYKPVAAPGPCTALGGLVGPEDLQIDRPAHLMFVSADDRRAAPDSPDAQDGIYVMDLAKRAQGFTKLAGTPLNFHPAGLSLFRAPEGGLTLMAVNHPTPGASEVDIFDVVQGANGLSLSMRTAVKSDLFSHVADVLAVGRDRFYATNDKSSQGLGGLISTYLLGPRGDVIYYDGRTTLVAYKGLRAPSGISAYPDYSYIYVSDFAGRRLNTFTGDPLTGMLTKTKAGSLRLPASPDNITLDTDGEVWVAAHPKALKLRAYAKNPQRPSPSEVWYVEILHGVPQGATLVYADRGKEIGGSSVAATANGRLFIGSAYDNKLLDCPLPKTP